jgi:7-cyano-7-deazaguanine synthase
MEFGNKALVIFSGGQDSTTILYQAIKENECVEAITFQYGQKHSIEIEQSKILCSINNIKQTIINIDFLDTIVNSALTSNGNVNELNEKKLPASFVPNRNQLFITLAHAYAQKINCNKIYIGVCQTDYSGYPDCRKLFIDLIQLTTNIGSDSDIEIITPLMFLNKAETFLLAEKLDCLNEVIEYSHTCYNGNRIDKHEWGYGCDNCPACNLRKEGFKKYKQNDN